MNYSISFLNEQFDVALAVKDRITAARWNDARIGLSQEQIRQAQRMRNLLWQNNIQPDQVEAYLGDLMWVFQVYRDMNTRLNESYDQQQRRRKA